MLSLTQTPRSNILYGYYPPPIPIAYSPIEIWMYIPVRTPLPKYVGTPSYISQRNLLHGILSLQWSASCPLHGWSPILACPLCMTLLLPSCYHRQRGGRHLAAAESNLGVLGILLTWPQQNNWAIGSPLSTSRTLIFTSTWHRYTENFCILPSMG